MDYNNKVIYADSLVIVSLRNVLREEHSFINFQIISSKILSKKIMPDVVASFLRQLLHLI
jgi:hypothetical protein